MSPEVATIIGIVITGTFGVINVYLAKRLNSVKKEVAQTKSDNKELRHLFNRKRNRIISILMLDNNPDDLEIVSRRLAKSGYVVEMFEDEEELTSRLTNSVNVILLDYYLKRKSAIEVIMDIKKNNYYNYIIVLSAHKNEDMLYNLSNSGIAKFVYKNDEDYLEKIEIYVNEAVDLIANL